MNKKFNKNKGISLIVFVLGILGFFAFAGFAIDFGLSAGAQLELQKATDSAALVGASNIEPQKDTDGFVSVNAGNVESIITDTFDKMKNANKPISNAQITETSVNVASKAVKLKTQATFSTFFMRFFGISNIVINAQAAAMSAPQYLDDKFPLGIIEGSLLKQTSGDSDSRDPVGDNANLRNQFENLYGTPDNKPLSLGPGGYVMIKFTSPLMDNEGADLSVRELGNIEGYYVFVGNDADPSDPYISETLPGGGIVWSNISCTGVPAGSDTGGKVGAYDSYIDNIPLQPKFYGSGYFDLGAVCTDSKGSVIYNGTTRSASYLKIIDDNLEDGFLSDNPTEPILLVGEHSSLTPGADLDAVAVLHHTRLISCKSFGTDTDGDGLIDILENAIGTDINLKDTDSDGISDEQEYMGWYKSGVTVFDIISPNKSKTVYYTNPNESDSDGKGLIDLQ